MHVFTCNHASNAPHEIDVLEKLHKTMRDMCTDPDVLEVILTADLRNWLNGSSVGVCRSHKMDLREACSDQSVIGWGNLFTGLAANEWAVTQQRHHKSLGKQRTAKRWLTVLLKHVMDAAWDMWDQQCEWQHGEGNSAESMALQLLDGCIGEECGIGIVGVPAHLQCLFHKTLQEALDLPDYQRKNWFQAIEAARGGVPVFIDEQRDDDTLSSDCRPERIGPRKWLSTDVLQFAFPLKFSVQNRM